MLLAVVFFLQQHMQPMPANMTAEQEQQRKMMKWMSLLFPVMLYGRAAGLSLYILTSTSIGIMENKIIRDHIKQRDEAEKAGRVIVDAAPTRNSKKRKDEDKKLLAGGKSPAKKSARRRLDRRPASQGRRDPPRSRAAQQRPGVSSQRAIPLLGRRAIGFLMNPPGNPAAHRVGHRHNQPSSQQIRRRCRAI